MYLEPYCNRVWSQACNVLSNTTALNCYHYEDSTKNIENLSTRQRLIRDILT